MFCPSGACRFFYTFYVYQELCVCGQCLGALLFLLIDAFDALVCVFNVFVRWVILMSLMLGVFCA